MPVGLPDEPPALPPDPSGSPSGGGSFGGDIGGASPSGFGGLGIAQSAFGSDPRRRQIFRGFRGLGDNIPIVTRERGIKSGGFNPTPGAPIPGVPGAGGGFYGDLDLIRAIRGQVGRGGAPGGAPPAPRPGGGPAPPPPPAPGPPPPPGGDTGGGVGGGGIIPNPLPPGSVPPPGTTMQNPPIGVGGGYGGGYETGERGRGQGGRIIPGPRGQGAPPRPAPGPPAPQGPPPPGGNPAGIDPFGGGITDPGTGEPIRRVRPPRTAGGGSGGYNGFPGGNFGMLSTFSGNGDPTGENLYGGAQRRYRSPYGFAVGGMVPGVTPGPPQQSDTVPALLTPGEIVMNRGVTSDPHNANALLELNQRGVQRMAMGGEVEDDGGDDMQEDRMESGRGFDPRILRLLGELLCALSGGEDDGSEGYGCGGMVRKGYAFGGMAGGFRPMGGRPVAPRPPQGGGGGNGFFNLSGPDATRGGTRNGWNYDMNGQVTNFNPNDPWGWMRANLSPTVHGAGQRLLGQAGQQGVFDPRGNQLLLNQQLEAAQGTKDALVRRGMAAADLSGLDPAQRAVAKLQTLRETGRGVQDISAGVRADAAGRADDFYRNLFNTYAGGDLSYHAAEQAGRQQRITNASASHGAKKGALGGAIGGLIGTGLGAFAGGYGGGLGKKLAGGKAG